MRTQLRIVAGSLRGRKLICTVSPDLRPTPQMVREALFSILGNAIPGRLFIDVFAGTGINGLEALSRGASAALFIERDFRLSMEIDQHLQEFGMADEGQVVRTDAYRWAQHWTAPAEPVNIFLSPPFADLHRRPEEFQQLVAQLVHRVSNGSVVVIQSEKHLQLDALPHPEAWEERRYGRNVLLLLVKGEAAVEVLPEGPPKEEDIE